MKKIFIYLFLITGFLSFAQGENNNWYFGTFIGLNFSTNPPTLLSGGKMNTTEAVGTMSKANGELLFYTDGSTIWNRQHEVMLNGTGLSGARSSQQLVISPYPGNDHLYYVFTMAFVFDGWNASGSFSAYSVVDMSLGGVGSDGLPLGGVVAASKNTPLLNELGGQFTVLSENIAAVPHANNQSYWILFSNNDKLYSYLLDSEGFHNTPVVSSLPEPVAPVQTHMHLRVSPKLSAELPYSHLISISRWPGGLAIPVSNYGIRVFSFDDSTGLITPDYLMTSNDYATFSYSSEFSSNGELLYTMNHRSMPGRVFDLVNGVSRIISPSKSANDCGSIQRAPNGEIYIATQAYSTEPCFEFISRIENQDSYLDCSVNFSGLFIGTDNMGYSSYGFPALIPILKSADEGCYEHLVYTFPEQSNSIHQAGSSITTSDYYRVDVGLDITLKAGNAIVMKSGSYIANGASFLANIEGCTTTPLLKSEKKNIAPIRFVINDVEGKKEMILYPNPSTDKVTVSVRDIIIKELTVLSSDGKQLFSRAIDSDSYVLDVSNYTNGIYIITITGSDGEIYTEKLVKK